MSGHFVLCNFGLEFPPLLFQPLTISTLLLIRPKYFIVTIVIYEPIRSNYDSNRKMSKLAENIESEVEIMVFDFIKA